VKSAKALLLTATVAAALLIAGPSFAQQYVSGAALPAAATYEPFVRQQIATMLRDPESARFEFGAPFKVTCRGRLFGMRDRWQGWSTEVWVNARNGYGGYTGRELYYVLFVNDGTNDGIEVHRPMTFELGTCRREVWGSPPPG
jgi:hypothetical protein